MSYTGKFEIVSLTGTLSAGCHHLHVAMADSTGAVFGGHLLPGCVVRTTVEIVLVRFLLPSLLTLLPHGTPACCAAVSGCLWELRAEGVCWFLLECSLWGWELSTR